ncbi:MAG: S41 family peptidase [Thermomicrobiales bacterium]
MVLLVGIVAGMLVERRIIADPSAPQPQFKSLEAVTSIIEDNYFYRPTEATAEATWTAQLEQQAITGMLGSLDDAYTRYLDLDAARSASNQLAGKYEGVGITIGTENDRVVISKIVPGGPADQAGVLVGDAILTVDGQKVAAGDDISSMIQGPAGTHVSLEVLRPGTSQPIQIDVTRQEILTPPVSYAIIPNTTIALIRIDIFGDQTTSLLTGFLKAAEQDHATGVVLDLRGNGGGWVTSAQEVIGRFVSSKDGPALFEDTTSAAGGEVALPIVNGPDPIYNGALIVLVDAGTASAAEIVAGALQDYNRAMIVGRKTFGKGSVQRIYDFKDGASMRMTVAEWLTPGKNRIQAVGIAPNVDVKISDHAESGKDADLTQAIALLCSGQNRPTDLAQGSSANPVASPIAIPAEDKTPVISATP